GYKYSEKLEFNVSYAHIFGVGNKRISIIPGNVVYNGLPFFGTVEPDVNIFGLSARYRWDDPKVAEAAPIIRKY
ncbi:MAG: transporter, partial [Methylobacteriaceae bacterium]|nr:transporter [Methylobacteriaceae bacterium]